MIRFGTGRNRHSAIARMQSNVLASTHSFTEVTNTRKNRSKHSETLSCSLVTRVLLVLGKKMTVKKISSRILTFFLWISLCGLVVRVPSYRSKGPGFDSLRYQIFWEVVGLERGPLSLVRITEELLEPKSGDSGLQNRDYHEVCLVLMHRKDLFDNIYYAFCRYNSCINWINVYCFHSTTCFGHSVHHQVSHFLVNNKRRPDYATTQNRRQFSLYHCSLNITTLSNCSGSLSVLKLHGPRHTSVCHKQLLEAGSVDVQHVRSQLFLSFSAFLSGTWSLFTHSLTELRPSWGTTSCAATQVLPRIL
jgi:hypothetical protein